MPAEAEQRSLTGLACLQECLDGVQHLRPRRLSGQRALVVHADLGVLQHRPHVVQIGAYGQEVGVCLAVVRGDADE
jgi:hypothetical protein